MTSLPQAPATTQEHALTAQQAAAIPAELHFLARRHGPIAVQLALEHQFFETRRQLLGRALSKHRDLSAFLAEMRVPFQLMMGRELVREGLSLETMRKVGADISRAQELMEALSSTSLASH